MMFFNEQRIKNKEQELIHCKMDSLAKDWSKMTDEELAIAAFGERIPQVRYTEDERPMVITISMDSETTQMPFGQVKTAPFLELFWRNTGADCDGEEERMKLPDGYTYLISLAAHCE